VRRDPNLDLLRAAAITLVLIFHIAGQSLPFDSRLLPFTNLGSFGVDLFFVLSGWLIGGLYWREHAEFGDVKIRQFLSRRWMRTLPPYYIAMFLGWLAVRGQRGEPFDAGYLLFFQNYYKSIPFFSVSWSLCIEEHFYLLLPWVLWIVVRHPKVGIALAALLIIMPPIWRWTIWQRNPHYELGYMFAATHLHCEGLVLGVVASAIAVLHPERWKTVQTTARYLAIPALMLFFSMAFWPIGAQYMIGYTALAFVWVIVLAAIAWQQPLPGARSSLIYWLAVSSYSIYLMHVLALHSSTTLAARLHISVPIISLMMAIVLIGMASAVFHFGVERTSILLRDRLMPRRAAEVPVGGVV
jgi:peptidoglycan/LPS O-acetylase OafA/YrhL